MNICCAKSACQVSDIIPEGEIIRETAQRIMQDSLGEKEVKLIAKALAETSPNPVACTSSLSRLRKELPLYRIKSKRRRVYYAKMKEFIIRTTSR